MRQSHLRQIRTARSQNRTENGSFLVATFSAILHYGVTMTERTRHQEKIIKNYYENRDSIGLQKAQEAVTELYLSEGKKRAQVWKRLTSHLAKIGLKEDQIAKLQEDDNPEQLAKLLEKYV
ncbi:hypothetical protein RMSM_02086 [Rhodopirellula maiorica SM1]|uniref:Uncharacterized protein n=1 Tax=Rhodopirellula maiorica SM1 TaxID=1265738 RepID=M5RNV6_9BACT|nr:hypothetical protein RMSM_02086 [Rhodopirellula maiorica SM1]